MTGQPQPGSGPLSITDPAAALDRLIVATETWNRPTRLHVEAVDALAAALTSAEIIGDTHNFTVRQVTTVATPARIEISRCTRVDLLAALKVAALSYVDVPDSTLWQHVIDVLSVATPWCEVLEARETVGQAMARVCDFATDVELLVLDIEHGGDGHR